MKQKLFYFLALSSVLVLSGCVARTYSMAKERVDQDISGGNRGFLMGKPSAEDSAARKSTREVRVFEFELGKSYPVKHTNVVVGQEQNIPAATESVNMETNGSLGAEPVASSAPSQKYTVGKNDTLQKISKKFYGTSKKWMKIYKVNTGVLKGPDKVYPGQVLNIPDEGRLASAPEALSEPKENLK
jgi:LysM repeat protein